MNWDNLDRRVQTVAKIVPIVGMAAAVVGAFVGVQFSTALIGACATGLVAVMGISAVSKGKQDDEGE